MSIKNPLVTIITCTYNSEKYILDNLNSVKNQTYPNIEHLIIDGKSSDKTLKIVNDFSKNIKVHSEKDGGIYDAFNKGIKYASGSIIGFLHSDDFFSSDFVIEKIIKMFQDSKSDGIYGNLEYINQNTKRRVRYWKSSKFKFYKLYFGWMPPHPALYLKKKVYEKNGKFNLKYKISSDYDFILRILIYGQINIKYLDFNILKMRLGGASNKNLKNILRVKKEDLNIINNHKLLGLFTLISKILRKLNQFLN